MILNPTLPTTLCRDSIWTHASRVAPDWDLWRMLFRLSYSAAKSYLLLKLCFWDSKLLIFHLHSAKLWDVFLNRRNRKVPRDLNWGLPQPHSFALPLGLPPLPFLLSAQITGMFLSAEISKPSWSLLISICYLDWNLFYFYPVSHHHVSPIVCLNTYLC